MTQISCIEVLLFFQKIIHVERSELSRCSSSLCEHRICTAIRCWNGTMTREKHYDFLSIATKRFLCFCCFFKRFFYQFILFYNTKKPWLSTLINVYFEIWRIFAWLCVESFPFSLIKDCKGVIYRFIKQQAPPRTCSWSSERSWLSSSEILLFVAFWKQG